MSAITRAVAGNAISPHKPVELETAVAPTVPVMAPLFVPNASVSGTRQYSRVQSIGAVHTTVSNLPYASVTDMRVVEAGPYTPSLVCGCGQPNPDSCVESLAGTMPYLDSALSRERMREAFSTPPYMPVGPVQAFLQMRAGPTNA